MGSGRGWFASKYGRIRIQVRPRNFVKISPEMPGKRVIHSLIFKKFLTRGGTPPYRALPPSWPSATQLVGLRPTAPRSFYIMENPDVCTNGGTQIQFFCKPVFNLTIRFLFCKPLSETKTKTLAHALHCASNFTKIPRILHVTVIRLS